MTHDSVCWTVPCCYSTIFISMASMLVFSIISSILKLLLFEAPLMLARASSSFLIIVPYGRHLCLQNLSCQSCRYPSQLCLFASRHFSWRYLFSIIGDWDVSSLCIPVTEECSFSLGLATCTNVIGFSHAVRRTLSEFISERFRLERCEGANWIRAFSNFPTFLPCPC